MNDADLDRLLDGFISEALDEQDWQELNSLLSDSENARAEFRSRIRIHRALAEHFSDVDEFSHFAEKPPVAKSNFRWIGIAATLVFGSAFLWVSFKPKPLPLAEVTASNSIETGPIWKGNFRLDEGFAEIEMENGARFAIEAGTEIDFQKRDRIRLIRGSLGADVPERGRGFTVVTPGGEVVDLGTRFGVSVDGEGNTQAELFKGEIEIHAKSGTENFQGTAVVTISEKGREMKMLKKSAQPNQFPMPQLVEIIPIAQGTFEPGEIYEIGESTRDKIGVWGGNVARIVTKSGQITPFEGDGMLQLVSSSHDLEASGRSFCDVLQWVDLRSYTFTKATVSARMKVNRIPGNEDTDTRFLLKVTPRSQSPAELAPEDRRRSPDLEWQVSKEADGDSATWENLELSAEITSDTKFLQLNVGAAENRQNNTGPDEVEFDGHFIDQVELQLLIPARPAIR